MNLTASDLAEWVSGIGSLLAVVVALWFSFQSRRDLAYGRLRQVHAWVENLHDEKGWKLVVQNSTEQPVFEWTCVVRYRSGDEAIQSEHVTQADVGIIPPGHYEFPWTPGHAPLGEAGIGASFTFVDATGRIWTRLSTGRLIRATLKEKALLSIPQENGAL